MNLIKKLTRIVNVQIIGRLVLRLNRTRDEKKLRRIHLKQTKTLKSDNPLNPPLFSSAKMKELVSKHYLEGRYVNGIRKVAWVTSGAPIEILRALDYHILYPEKHAALCGARKQTVDIASEAEQFGYSRDICSYARTDIGAVLSGKTPVGKLPKPDLLFACTNICQTVLYWYRVLAMHFDIPLIIIDTPFLYQEAQVHQIEYVKKQLEDAIPTTEKIAGKQLSYKRLQDVITLSKEAAELWLAILNRAQHQPAPISSFDGFIHLAPIVDQRGKQETIHYYKTMLHEIDERIQKGMGAIKEEKKRVLWDNLPIWFRLREHSHKLAQNNINIVAATYTHAWGELAPMMDPSRPVESMGKTYLHPILNRSAGHKLDTIRKMIADFHIDGVILHSDRSCKPYSLGQMDQRDRLVYEYGVPALLLEADHNDPRSFSEEQTNNRLEAFFEMMEYGP